MTIHIADFIGVSTYHSAGITHIVSLGSHDIPVPHVGQFRGDFTLHRFVFDDLSHPDPKGPTEEIIDRLLNTLAAIPADANVLFHCTAGRARSPAAAFLWLVMKGMSYQQAYDEIVKVRGVVQPNLLMVKYADRLLGHNGAMTAWVAQYSGHADWLAQQSW